MHAGKLKVTVDGIVFCCVFVQFNSAEQQWPCEFVEVTTRCFSEQQMALSLKNEQVLFKKILSKSGQPIKIIVSLALPKHSSLSFTNSSSRRSNYAPASCVE